MMTKLLYYSAVCASAAAFQLPPSTSSFTRLPLLHRSLQASSSRPLSSLSSSAPRLPYDSVTISSRRRRVGTTALNASLHNNDDNDNDSNEGDSSSIEESISNNTNNSDDYNNDDNDNEDSYISKRYPNPRQTSWAYSGLTNAWGYSARLVTKRERRRYERRRIRHRRKVEANFNGGSNSIGGGSNSTSGEKRRLNWVSRMMEEDIIIGAGDAFVGNVKKGSTGSSSTDADTNNDDNTKFDDDEMDEDGYWNMLGKKKTKRSILKQLIRIPYRALFGEYRTHEPGTLILVRHGESLWNANKTFTGWANPDLSPQGYREVEHAARLLLEGGYKVDVVFTSRLKRAIRSSWLLLRELNEVYLPVFKSWRLNERMYGALTGLSKTETAERLGPKLVQEWRGSLKSRPPPLSPADRYYPGRDRSHADLTPDQIPLTESLLGKSLIVSLYVLLLLSLLSNTHNALRIIRLYEPNAKDLGG